jgi:negative regulator of sigma E activity
MRQGGASPPCCSCHHLVHPCYRQVRDFNAAAAAAAAVCCVLQQFDKGAPSPQLMQLLSSGQLPVAGKRALVPGCG